MSSRERVLTTLDHREPDKVPIDFGGNQSSSHILAYKRLLEHLEIEDPNIRFADVIQQIAYPTEKLLEKFEVDIRWLRPPKSIMPENFTPEYEGNFRGVRDQFGVFWGCLTDRDPEDPFFNDPVIHPLKDMKTVEEIKNYNWPDGTDRTPLIGLREEAKRLRKTSYAIGTPPLGCIYEYTTFLFGFATVLRHLRRSPELIIAAMEELEKYWTDYAKTFLNEIKFGNEFYVDIIAINGDLAMETGPIMNPKEIYEPLIKPLEGKFSHNIHDFANVKINYHSCGSIIDFIPHFADIGYDAINPVQVGARNMDPCSLKKKFGSIITFWGGVCDTSQTLPFGTPSQIKKEVKYNVGCFKPGGGYIASNVHNITAEVPPENVVAMFEAVKMSRNY